MIKLKDLILEEWNSNIWQSDIWNSNLWNSDIWNSHIWENEESEEKLPIENRLGQCYKLSGQYVMYHSGWELIHGKVVNPFVRGHSQLEHAWAEKGNEVFDLVMHKVWPKDVYYSLFKVKVHKKFTQQEVFQLTDKHAHWGPWENYD